MTKRNKSKGKLGSSILSLFLLFFMVLVISLGLYQTFQVDLLMQDLRKLEDERKNLLSETEQLQGEVDRLGNIDRIGKIASEKYHLVNNTDDVLVLELKDPDKLESLKRKFARRSEKQEEYKLAGVH